MMPASGRSSISPHDNPPSSRRTPKNSTNGRGAQGAARLEVLDRIGEGTLWIVYRVRERGVSGAPLLALKALKTAPNRHPRLPEKLFQTGLEWQKLSHPNLAGLHEVGVEENTYFQLGELLLGGSLEAKLAKGLPSPQNALKILAEIARGLDYLHSRHVFHGDIRTRQILFDKNGTPKITDGNVASAFAQSGLALADVQGDCAYYLAPERTQGAPFSAAADVYSLGVVFYRMLTGRVPFDGPSTLAISARHRTDAVALPSQFRPQIPAEIEQLALQMLEKDAAKRPSAAQIANWNAVSNAAPQADLTPTILPPVAPAVAAQNATQNAASAAVVATAPKRQPMDDLVAQQMAADDDAKQQVNLKVAKKRHRRREFWGFVGALLWLLILVGAGAGGAYGVYEWWKSESPQEVVVPKYIGLNQEEAKTVLAKKGLYMKVVREAYDPKVPAGTVLTGEPDPGRTVRSRREVTVTVSVGRAPIKMVDFSRLTLNQARRIIVQHGLRLGQVVQQYHETIPDTFICGQFPEPGEPLRRSEPITLIVSRGPQPTEIDGTQDQNIADPVPQVAPPVADALGSNDFQPLEEAPVTQQTDQTSAPMARSERAAIRVQVPEGEAQNVRILVRDARGERTVYQQVKRGGSNINETVRISKNQGEAALVRVYIGEELVDGCFVVKFVKQTW